MENKYVSRKFVIWIVVSILATALLYLGKISDIIWAALVGGESLTYKYFNVRQKLGIALKDKKKDEFLRGNL